MAKRRRGGNASWNKIVRAQDAATAAATTTTTATTATTFSSLPSHVFQSNHSVFVFILPQSSNDPKGQSVTFEYNGSLTTGGTSLQIDIKALRHCLRTQHAMHTPQLTYQGRSVSTKSAILNCNVRETLICYDIFESKSHEPVGSPDAPIEVIDVDDSSHGSNKVIDLLSDTDEESEIITHESDRNLALLVSMGFQTKVALQALRAVNGNVALATQRLLDGGGSSSEVTSSSSTSSSSTSSTSSTSSFSSPTTRKRARSSVTGCSIFDGHPGIQRARKYIATADEFDEAIACQDLPRHGILLEHVSVRPLEYYKALLCRSRESDDNRDMTDQGRNGGGGGGGGGGWGGMEQTTTLLMRADQAADLATLEEEFEESDIPRAEIRQMFVVMGHNVESTRAALLSG